MTGWPSAGLGTSAKDTSLPPMESIFKRAPFLSALLISAFMITSAHVGWHILSDDDVEEAPLPLASGFLADVRANQAVETPKIYERVLKKLRARIIEAARSDSHEFHIRVNHRYGVGLVGAGPKLDDAACEMLCNYLVREMEKDELKASCNTNFSGTSYITVEWD